MVDCERDSLGSDVRAIAKFADAVASDGVRRTQTASQLAATSGIEARSVERLLALWPTGFDADAMAQRIAALRRSDRLPGGTVVLIAAGNMPVATWTATMELLALGVSVRIRPASGDPDAAPALVDWLLAVAPTLAARIEIVPCSRHDTAGWHRLLLGSRAVVVFGGDAATVAVSALARSLGFGGPVRSHGDKLSLGWLDPAAFALRSAEQRARWLDDVLEAALLADGRGCLSLRALLVSGTEEQARNISELLAARADSVAASFPDGTLALDRVAAASLALEDDRLDAVMTGGFVAESGAGAAGRWSIAAVGAPRQQLTAADLGPGARHLRVIAVAPSSPLPTLLSPLRGHLAALALLQPGSATSHSQAQAAGFWRVCGPEQLQAPPWHCHDGVPAGTGLVEAG